MITDSATYRDGVRKATPAAVADAALEARTDPDTFAWVSLHDPGEPEFDAVAEAFALHELIVEDVMEAHQRPKLEVYDDVVFMSLRAAWYERELEQVQFSELSVLLGSGFVVSVDHGHVRVPAHLRRTLEADVELLRSGPSAVLYGIVDQVVDGYAPIIASLEADIDEVEEEVFSPGAPSVAPRIYKLKREVLHFFRTASMLVEPLDRLARRSLPNVDERLRHYFRDVHDHLLRMVAQLHSFRELLTSALEANLAQIGVRQNEDMRRISAWVAVAAVPTLIAGIYGMNFAFMPGLAQPWGFPAVIALIAVICAGLYGVFRRNGWL